MTRVGGVILMMALACTSLVLSSFGQEAVLDPTIDHYTYFDLGSLLSQTVALENVVAYSDLGSQKQTGPEGWTPLQFARYAQGILAFLGYEAVAVTDALDPARSWVLVKVELMTRAAWIPVEPTPAHGAAQGSLGRIPWNQDDSGAFRFEDAYKSAYVEFPAAPNRPPNAYAYPPRPPVYVNQELTFRSIGSRDPDGSIVLYLWEFGDGATVSTTSDSIVHVYSSGGGQTVQVIAFDDLGTPSKPASAHITVRGELEHCVPCGY